MSLLFAPACQRRAASVDDRGASRFPIQAAPLASVPAEARAYYQERCVSCHGASGRGDGPQAAGQRPRPRDLSDRLWQSNVTTSHLRRVIVGGGGAVGKSIAMPAQPQLAKDLQGSAMLDGLVTLVRSFAAE